MLNISKKIPRQFLHLDKKQICKQGKYIKGGGMCRRGSGEGGTCNKIVQYIKLLFSNWMEG